MDAITSIFLLMFYMAGFCAVLLIATAIAHVIMALGRLTNRGAGHEQADRGHERGR